MSTLITPAPTAEPEFTSIYSKGDLILVNPQQSTVIFLSVIIFSTLLEYVIERVQQAKNKYVRTIVFAAKDEITNISFVGMLLLCVAFSFPLSSSWRTVIQWVDMCIVYMAAGYVIMISCILALLKIRTNTWRTFEWARITASSHHTGREDLFKTARDYFVLLVKTHDPDVAAQLDDHRLVTYSTYLAKVERSNLQEITDFSHKTWFGLGLIIIINGSRAITAASVTDDESTNNLLQVISYVVIIGYGSLAAFGICHTIFERRFRSHLVSAIFQANKEGAEEGGDLDRSGITPQSCFYFKDMGATLEVFKICMLSMMWYSAVQIMAYTYVAWTEMGYYSILLCFFAAVPVIVFVWIFPWTLNLIFMCDTVADNFDFNLVKRLLDEEAETDSESSEDEDDGGDGDDFDDDGKVKKKRGGVEEDAELAEIEDEWNGPEVTLHSTADPDRQPKGEPTKVQGAFHPVKYVKREVRPVFHL